MQTAMEMGLECNMDVADKLILNPSSPFICPGAPYASPGPITITGRVIGDLLEHGHLRLQA